MPKYKVVTTQNPGAQISLPVGQTLTLQALAYNDTGAPIEVDGDEVQWTINSGCAGIASTNLADPTSCQLSGVAIGSANVTASATINGQPFTQTIAVSVG